MYAVDDRDAGGISVGIQQVDRIALADIDGAGSGWFVVDDRLHQHRAGCGEYLAAHLDFEPEVEDAVCQTGGRERPYVQDPLRVVGHLLDLTQALLGLVQPHRHQPLRRVAAEIQLHHLGRDLIQAVSVGVGRLAIVSDIYMHRGRPDQLYLLRGRAEEIQGDLGLRVREVVDFGGRIRLVTSGTEVVTAELPRRVVQGDLLQALVDVAGRRRLVVNHRAHPLRIERKQRLPAHADLEVRVEVTVRLTGGRKRLHVQDAWRVVGLLGDQAHRADVRMQQHLDRPVRLALARQMQLDQLGLDLVQPVVVIVQSLTLGRLEVDHRDRGTLDRDHFRIA